MLRQVRAAHSSQNFTTVPHQTTNSKATRTLNVSKALLKSGTLQNVQLYLLQVTTEPTFEKSTSPLTTECTEVIACSNSFHSGHVASGKDNQTNTAINNSVAIKCILLRRSTSCKFLSLSKLPKTNFLLVLT